MNDEIKECLDSLYYQDDYSSISYDKLLDYIIKLQQYYKDNINKYEELIEKYSNLQQENERLKEILKWKQNREPELFTIESVLETNKQLYDERNMYKSRCEKINEILKESPDFNYSNDYIILKRKIESVLQGENNE